MRLATMTVKAVLFDLGGTLVSYYDVEQFEPVLRESLAACLDVLGRPALDDAARGELLREALKLNEGRADEAVWPLQERLARLFEVHPGDCAALARLCSAFLQPIFAMASPDRFAVPLLAELGASGIRTAIVSNTPWGSPAEAWRAELATHGLLDRVDAVVFCVDVGWRKPHAAPFAQALELLGVDASEAVFVGDDPHWDVIGARRAGLTPVLISRHPRLRDPSPHVLTVSALEEIPALVDRLNKTE